MIVMHRMTPTTAHEDDPDEVEDRRAGTPAVHHLCAKGRQGQLGHLERLLAHRDADDRDAQDDADHGPAKRDRKATEHKPQNVSNKSHAPPV